MNTSKKLVLAVSLLGLCSQAAADVSAKRDITYDQGGMIKQEYIYQENPRFLNKAIPDQYGYFKTTMEFKNGFKAGQRQFGHDAVEGLFVLRHKSVMGTAGSAGITDAQSVKIGDAFVGDIKHNSSKPLLWIKEGWIKTTLNSIFGFNSEDIHFVKVGMLGHSVGRGIALGSEYGSPKDFLANYGQSNDFCAPGILLAGDVLNKGISYTGYVGFLENKSSSIKDTFNILKANQIGRETTPWTGTGNNNTMYALAVTLRPIETDKLTLALTPYIVYNRALDQAFDVAADSESHLKTIGAHINLQNDKAWGIDVEAAMNMGNEQLYNIDRNTIQLAQGNATAGQKAEYIKGTYSHISQLVGDTYVPAPAYYELRNELATNRHLANSQVFQVTVDGTNTTFKTASNRIRPAYKNTYAGFMGVADAFYKLEAINSIFSVAAGYLSGDANPHATEADKTYRGFIAMHEFYTGKYVKSAFMFDTRSVKRPLSFERGDTSLEDASFTDLIFGGYGFTWNSEKYKAKKAVINTNGLLFWKEFPSYKVDPTTGAPTTELARTFMGTELNLIASMEPLPYLTVMFKGGVFFPGAYYHDIQGVALPGDVYKKLDAPDTTDLVAANYRLGKDTALVATVSVDYRF